MRLQPAPEDAADRCRPRLSAALFDASGKVRFRYHADFAGAVSAELIGDGCRGVAFTYDAAAAEFRPATMKPAAVCVPRAPK